MSTISISLIELLIKGIPEGFLFVLAVYVLTRTEIDTKKYIMISVAFTIVTYLIRFLPIALGVNTMLSLLALILLFLAFYKFDMQKVVKTIIAVVVIAIIIVVTEELNVLLLDLRFGPKESMLLLNSSSSLTKSVSMIPSTVLFAVAVFILYLVFRKTDKNKKGVNGEIGKAPGK